MSRDCSKCGKEIRTFISSWLMPHVCDGCVWQSALENAERKMLEATENGDEEEIDMWSRRLRRWNDAVKRRT